MLILLTSLLSQTLQSPSRKGGPRRALTGGSKLQPAGSQRKRSHCCGNTFEVCQVTALQNTTGTRSGAPTNKCSLGQVCAEPWAFCAPLEPSSLPGQFLFTPLRGDSEENWPGHWKWQCWGWQLTLGSSKLSSHGQNSEHTVLCVR